MAEKSVILLGLWQILDGICGSEVSVAEKSVILLGPTKIRLSPKPGCVSVAEKSVILLGRRKLAFWHEYGTFQWLKSLLYCWDLEAWCQDRLQLAVSVAEKSVILLGTPPQNP